MKYEAKFFVELCESWNCDIYLLSKDCDLNYKVSKLSEV